ncbi:hypothetical protein SNEBB_000180 [Seison nebaliae]|nr:hypothetical protein SNEBB_000180 [Seison nebaliae]
MFQNKIFNKSADIPNVTDDELLTYPAHLFRNINLGERLEQPFLKDNGRKDESFVAPIRRKEGYMGVLIDRLIMGKDAEVCTETAEVLKKAIKQSYKHATNLDASHFGGRLTFKENRYPLFTLKKVHDLAHNQITPEEVEKLHKDELVNEEYRQTLLDIRSQKGIFNRQRAIERIAPSENEQRLAVLRFEQLRLEELLYLTKAQEARLEETRGPLPQWYELKTTQFHKEHQKNMKLLRTCPNWQKLLDKRTALQHSHKMLLDRYRRYEALCDQHDGESLRCKIQWPLMDDLINIHKNS